MSRCNIKPKISLVVNSRRMRDPDADCILYGNYTNQEWIPIPRKGKTIATRVIAYQDYRNFQDVPPISSLVQARKDKVASSA